MFAFSFSDEYLYIPSYHSTFAFYHSLFTCDFGITSSVFVSLLDHVISVIQRYFPIYSYFISVELHVGQMSVIWTIFLLPGITSTCIDHEGWSRGRALRNGSYG